MFRQGMFFIDPSKETPESIAKKRAAIKELSGGFGRAQNIPEGVGDLFRGIAIGVKERGLAKAEKAGQASASSLFGSILDGAFANDPSAPSTPIAPDSATVQPASLGPSSGGGEPVNWDGSDLRSGIAATAQSLGIDPVDLATAISYETAGTFDPTKRGPTTQWGQHRGLIQFGEPQAKKYGVNWDDPIGSQLGPEGAVAKYLRDTGVREGMGLLDIYSAINAGGVGRYNRSDANNGGAPGTVRDKVEKQMAGHRAKAQKLFADWQGGASPAQAAIQAQAPIQTASLDPSSGVNQAMAYAPQPTRQPALTIENAQPQEMAIPRPQMPTSPMAMQRGQGNGLPMDMVRASPQLASANPEVGILRELTGRAGMEPGATGAFPAAPGQPRQQAPQQVAQAQQQGGGLSTRELIEAAQNPWLNAGQREVVNMLLQERMQQRDPMRQLEMQRMRQQLQTGAPDYISPADQQRIDLDRQRFGLDERRLEADINRPVSIGGALVNPQTGQPVYQAPREPMTVNPGQFVIDPQTGRSIFEAPAEPGFSVLSPQEVQSLGLPAGAYQRGPKGEIKPIGGGGVNVTTNVGGNTSEFVKESDKAAAARMNDIIVAGQSAPQKMADMQQLIDLGAQIGTGRGAQLTAALGPYAEALGVDIGNMGEIQAYEAITSRLAPQMRAPGSGASSDRDVAMFLQALPNLRNTQSGNEIIGNTMKAVAQAQIDAAEIARRATRGEISWQDAETQISKLPNPYERFKEFMKAGEQPDASQQPEGPSIDDLLKQYGGN